MSGKPEKIISPRTHKAYKRRLLETMEPTAISPSATVEREAKVCLTAWSRWRGDQILPDEQFQAFDAGFSAGRYLLRQTAALPRAPEVQRLAEAVEAWMRDSIDIEELHPKWKQRLTAALTAALAAPPVERREIKRVCHPSDRECIWPDCGSKCDGSHPVDPVKQIYDEADAAMTAYGEWCEQEDVAASPSTRDAFLAGYAAHPSAPPVDGEWDAAIAAVIKATDGICDNDTCGLSLRQLAAIRALARPAAED